MIQISLWTDGGREFEERLRGALGASTLREVIHDVAYAVALGVAARMADENPDRDDANAFVLPGVTQYEIKQRP